jgi:hypothetical protein
MRKIMLLAAIVAALGMVSQATEARDRGFGFRHFSGHAGPKLHLRHHGLKFHHGGFFRKPRPFKSRHFGHRGFASKFGHVPHFKPRHFGQGGLVLKFGDGDFMLRFGHMPHFKHHNFRHRHHHHGLFFGLDQPRQFRPWHDRGFAFKDRHELLPEHRQSMPGAQGGQGGGLHRGAPPEALLRQLEQMGFDTCQSFCAARIPEKAPVSRPCRPSSSRRLKCAK